MSLSTIPKPAGQFGRDYKLIEAMQLGEGAQHRYQQIQQLVRALSMRHLDINKPYTSQLPVQLDLVRQETIEQFPILLRYETHWPINAMIQQYLQNRGRRRKSDAKTEDTSAQATEVHQGSSSSMESNFEVTGREPESVVHDFGNIQQCLNPSNLRLQIPVDLSQPLYDPVYTAPSSIKIPYNTDTASASIPNLECPGSPMTSENMIPLSSLEFLTSQFRVLVEILHNTGQQDLLYQYCTMFVKSAISLSARLDITQAAYMQQLLLICPDAFSVETWKMLLEGICNHLPADVGSNSTLYSWEMYLVKEACLRAPSSLTPELFVCLTRALLSTCETIVSTKVPECFAPAFCDKMPHGHLCFNCTLRPTCDKVGAIRTLLEICRAVPTYMYIIPFVSESSNTLMALSRHHACKIRMEASLCLTELIKLCPSFFPQEWKYEIALRQLELCENLQLKEMDFDSLVTMHTHRRAFCTSIAEIMHNMDCDTYNTDAIRIRLAQVQFLLDQFESFTNVQWNPHI